VYELMCRVYVAAASCVFVLIHCRGSLGQIRAVLQRGLETIRLVGHGGLDVDLIVHLARTFANRVKKALCVIFPLRSLVSIKIRLKTDTFW